jgi:hypothetical protein
MELMAVRNHPQNYRFFSRNFLIRGFVALVILTAWSPAHAQFIDRIEISRRDKEAEIRIQFSSQVQYISHSPPEEGRLLQIHLRHLADPSVPEGGLIQETLHSPKTDLVPGFTVTYPSTNDALLITFTQSTRFTVKPEPDGRSIILMLPLLPGAKDFSVETQVKDKPRQEALKVPATVPSEKPSAPPPVAAVPGSVIAPSEALSSAPAREAVRPVQAPQSMPADASAVTAPPALSAEKTEMMASLFMSEARSALASKDGPKAINRLYRILGLPANSLTQVSQALIGEAREMNGEFTKARAEYELYLKLFPKGAEASQVRQRLAALPKNAPGQEQSTLARKAPKDTKPPEWVTTASISQYRYFGNSHIETITPPPPGQLLFNVDTLSLEDQNSMISTLNINARRRGAMTDTRIVVRDTDNKNYLPGKSSTSYNRLYSAYLEHTDKEVGYFARVGRQNPSGGGVMERFDGLSLGYNINPRWRVNGAAGNAVEFLSPFDKKFYGVSLDMLAQPSEWGFSTFLVQQTLDGALNRRATGAEVRYFDSQATVYGMVDYDLAFKSLNIALVQGNYLDQKGNNYYAIVDHRKSPTMGLPNAMSGSPGLTVQEMIATLGIDEVRRQAIALTSVSNMFSVGVTHPLTQDWQLGGDYRLSSVSGTEAAGSMPAQAGSPNNHVFSVRAIGNNLFISNAVGSIDASLILAPTFTGQAYGISYVLLFKEAWRLDSNLHYYTQKDEAGEKQKRWSPTMKLSYRWKDSISLEAEFGKEIANIDGPLRVENSVRTYMYFGYRWDFR